MSEKEAPRCAYLRTIREANYWHQTEPKYETCDSLPIEGSEYCRKHNGRPWRYAEEDNDR